MTNKFLEKLKLERKIKLVEPSEAISKSYSKKSKDCFASAKILLNNKLYENSISMAYYAIYNELLSLLFKTGIKSENHTGSIIMLKELFNETKL